MTRPPLSLLILRVGNRCGVVFLSHWQTLVKTPQPTQLRLWTSPRILRGRSHPLSLYLLWSSLHHCKMRIPNTNTITTRKKWFKHRPCAAATGFETGTGNTCHRTPLGIHCPKKHGKMFATERAYSRLQTPGSGRSTKRERNRRRTSVCSSRLMSIRSVGGTAIATSCFSETPLRGSSSILSTIGSGESMWNEREVGSRRGLATTAPN
mmetsp:Transcript_10384/g.24734  ORF Transcript_10384/g.24734 Transcript_10384/m.24734 type:complete len:208 (-) Transcript_10384:788-1411(-)